MKRNVEIVGKIEFPEFLGLKCIMMPFIQGDIYSVPVIYASYFDIIANVYLEKGRIGHLTIDESFVKAGNSQRGYNSTDSARNVHIEVGIHENSFNWGGSVTWGKNPKVTLEHNTRILIANSIDDTCRVWDTTERSKTKDGDLSAYLHKYPENTGRLLKAGEVAEISIFTPHECVTQTKDSNRQFFRIVGEGVYGREDYFTINTQMRKNR